MRHRCDGAGGVPVPRDSSSVIAYFSVGAGSLGIGDQPGWVGDMVDPGSTGIDAGAATAADTTAVVAAATTAADSAAASTAADSGAVSTAAGASAEPWPLAWLCEYPVAVRDTGVEHGKVLGAQAAGARSRNQEQIARYSFLIDKLPSAVIEKRACCGFHGTVGGSARSASSAGLRPLLSGGRRRRGASRPGEPDALASLVRAAGPRDAMISTGVAGVIACEFVRSAPVGRVLARMRRRVGEPSTSNHRWVSELVRDHDAAPIDGGTVNHRKGVNSGHWF